METQHPQLEERARRILRDVSICLGKIVGKYTGYPHVDAEASQRVQCALEQGLTAGKSAAKLGDTCQELRAVTSCSPRELLSFPGADEPDLRIAAILQALRARAQLSDELFREVLTASLSWERVDKCVILEALTQIIRR